ncbi:MAG: glycoside hydrolase family 2 protein [Clostridiales bacterium]|jgi:beta-mannosidase|nr:glycoside hydrolase family 2 protein [Clostridiales bacterium]
MKTFSLSGAEWRMAVSGGQERIPAKVPGSVYADLLAAGKMGDPYWRDNELGALALMEGDFDYEAEFALGEEFFSSERVLLCFDGLDTLCDVYLNGAPVASCDNMHRRWKFDVKGLLRRGGNALRLHFRSPTKYIREAQKECFIDGSGDAMAGFPHIRKAHCMFGWDWGPRLPDAGVWRDAYLMASGRARIDGVLVTQEHAPGMVTLSLRPELDFGGGELAEFSIAGESGALRAENTQAEYLAAALGGSAWLAGGAGAGAAAPGKTDGVGSALAGKTGSAGALGGTPVGAAGVIAGGADALAGESAGVAGSAQPASAQSAAAQPASAQALAVVAKAVAPDGREYAMGPDGRIAIGDPQLWWPRGYGGQPLYLIRAELLLGGVAVDSWERRVGLREMGVSRAKDEWGEEFCHVANGVKIFAMGADYIPEDNILPRMTPERTRRLLEDAALAGMNAVRVWGGGHYPSDAFYDICDELGLVVWQDFMFACAMYELTDEFLGSIERELADNVRRLRHHASLGLFCGNNEMEWQVDDKAWRYTPKQYSDYIRMYEHVFPAIVKKHAPQAFYWPASPSSGGGFDKPNDPNRGDVHFWEVWHGNRPFSYYRNFHFRYASEFGFQSFPSMKTVRSFTAPEDRNIFSYVMEKHQRNNAANGKIMNYMGDTFLYPTSLDILVYASQLLQAEAIRYGVEHWRRNRGRCMGAIYWQLNDCWPVASWSSIDYFGRWKALHYFAKRFFAKVLLSCCEQSVMTQNTNPNAEPYEVEKSAELSVANETLAEFSGTVRWALRRSDAGVVRQGEIAAKVPALASKWLGRLDFADASLYDNYLSYELYGAGGERLSGGSVLFCQPKHFKFEDPRLSASVASSADGEYVVVRAAAYARAVEIDSDSSDFLLEDNYFDMDAGERRIKVLRGKPEKLFARSVYDIR